MADLFMLTYACDSPASFASVQRKWSPEISRHCPDAMRVLIGTKEDLRPSATTAAAARQFVSPAEGDEVCLLCSELEGKANLIVCVS